MHAQMSGKREFDVVVYGASGVTGKYVVYELLRSAPALSVASESPPQSTHALTLYLAHAVGGRSKSKLEEVASQAESRTGKKANLPILVADVSSHADLVALASKVCIIG